MFDKMKQMYELKKKADALKKELENEIVEVEAGDIKIRVSADQKIRDITFGDSVDPKNLRDAINKALEESQKVAAEKMKGMMGGMGGLSDLLK